MKKFFISISAVLLLGSSAFAKKWTNNVGVGFDYQKSLTSYDSSDYSDISQNSFGIHGTYIGVHENGFTAKADLNFGICLTDDISIQDFDTNIGFFESYLLGAGYSFVNTDRFLAGITGMVGLDMWVYGFTETQTVASVDHDYTTSVLNLTFSTGFDLFARAKISDHFGFYGNLGIRYQVAGVSLYGREDSYESGGTVHTSKVDEDELLLGKYIIEPSVGFMWVF